ncbi:MAG: OsmC family protein [Planctomycetota bacterium]|jgi:putative redox protein
MYAERKGWPLEGVEMRLRHQKVKAEGQTVPIDEIDAEIRILGDLDEAQRERLLDIAHRCPVHRTLLSEVKIRMQAV